MAIACALGLDQVAIRFAVGDLVERRMWGRVLDRAAELIKASNDG